MARAVEENSGRVRGHRKRRWGAWRAVRRYSQIGCAGRSRIRDLEIDLTRAYVEQRRSRILEAMNASRPLAQTLEEITELVSFRPAC